MEWKDFQHKSPGWTQEGVEPPPERKEKGYEVGHAPPADWFNWFWTRVSRCIEEIQEKVRSLWTKVSEHSDDKTSHTTRAEKDGWDSKAAGEHNHRASDITSGTLPASRGGTGETSLQATRNAMGLGNTSGALPVLNGGTGATTVAAARNALGLGNTSGAVPIASGGTGATTISDARYALGLGSTSGALPIANGGTGSTSVASARSALGLGYTSGALPVANGGTGQTYFTSGQALIGNGSSNVITRAITDTPSSGSASLLTAGGAYAALLNKANLTTPSELNLPLLTGFIGRIDYWKNQFDEVSVRCDISKNTGLVLWGSLGTLPTGYRPKVGITLDGQFVTSDGFPVIATLSIATSGNITVTSNPGTNIGVRFQHSFLTS